jgi:serine protease Do
MRKKSFCLILILISTLTFFGVACSPSFVGLDLNSDRLSSNSSNESNDSNFTVGTPAEYQVSINTVTPTIIEGGLPEVVQNVRDTVVSLSCVVIDGEGNEGNSSGSGVFFATDESNNSSFILTCCHVIDQASEVEAILVDGTKLDCELIGGDDEKDIAVLKTSGIFPTADVRNMLEEGGAPLELAESVFAIGNPLGTLGGSVTQGIISGTERIINMDGVSMNLLQIDVAVNPGNSGGPLFDYSGALVGIVNAKSVGTDVEGIGYAIKIDDAIDIAESLLSTAGNPEYEYKGYIEGKVRLGVTVQGAFNSEENKYFYSIVALNVYGSVAQHNSSATDDKKIYINDIITGIKVSDETMYFTDINTLGDIVKTLEVGDVITLLVKHPTKYNFITGYTYESREIEIIMVQYVYGL